VDVASAGVVALFALFLVKESGIPVPVPGDLIVIGAGVAAARGDIEPVTGFAIGNAAFIGAHSGLGSCSVTRSWRSSGRCSARSR